MKTASQFLQTIPESCAETLRINASNYTESDTPNCSALLAPILNPIRNPRIPLAYQHRYVQLIRF
jgi:hypothetical protein